MLRLRASASARKAFPSSCFSLSLIMCLTVKPQKAEWTLPWCERKKLASMSAIIAKPPGEHCVRGVQHTGEPKGHIEDIRGIQTYISLPPDGISPKGVVIFYSDVFGPLFINNKLLQDYYASQGAGVNYV